MDWINPTTFNHHIQLKKFQLGEKESILTDKFAVRSYVSKIIGEEYLVPIHGVHNSIDEVEFETDHNIVIKTTHGSGPEHIELFPTSKTKQEVLEKFNRAMGDQYNGVKWGEFQYECIVPRILVEEKIGINGVSPDDYKFHMFNSKSGCKWFMQINTNRQSALKQSFYDENFAFLEVEKSGLPNTGSAPPERAELEKMLKIAKQLSVGLDYVRVDLYLVDQYIYFGELTFTPACGFGEFSDLAVSEKFGSYFQNGGE